MTAPRYVLIANPGTKRCETYRAELLAYWAARGTVPDLERQRTERFGPNDTFTDHTGGVT